VEDKIADFADRKKEGFMKCMAASLPVSIRQLMQWLNPMVQHGQSSLEVQMVLASACAKSWPKRDSTSVLFPEMRKRSNKNLKKSRKNADLMMPVSKR